MTIYIKSENEIEGFKEAGKIAGSILQKLIKSVDVGMTTNSLDQMARDECKKNNVIPTFLGYMGFPAAICTSVNETLVHGIPNDTPLKKGDIISIDMGVTLGGFIGDTASTTIVGSNPNNDALITACNNALHLGIKMARPGNRISDISMEVYHIAIRNKYSVPVEYGGHGIDWNVLHSDPFIPNIPYAIEDEYNIKLRPGMVFAIEPMFIVGSNELKVSSNGWDVVAQGMTAHFEHTILVTEGDPLILTSGG